MKRLTLRFAWYDLWVGAFIDRAKQTLYVCPLPCVLITWRYERRVLPRPAPRPDAPPVNPEWLARTASPQDSTHESMWLRGDHVW